MDDRSKRQTWIYQKQKKIPMFEGYVTTYRWSFQVEQHFDAEGTPESEKQPAAVDALEGHAYICYKILEVTQPECYWVGGCEVWSNFFNLNMRDKGGLMTKKHHIWVEDEKQRKGDHDWKEVGMAEDKVREVAIERMVNEEECHKKMEGMMAMVNKEESQRNIEQEVSSELTSMGIGEGSKGSGIGYGGGG